MPPEEPARILVVDDEKTNIDVMVGLLSDEYKVIIAKNGQQALKRVQSDPLPDIILLDIIMPGMDGYEVCRQLKSDKNSAAIPIIFITGMSNPADETKGLELGAVDFIRKPFSPNVVLARIHTHISLQQQKKRLLELNVLKNKFLGMAAHDLRNPLNSICGLSEILLHMKLSPEEHTKFLSMIYTNGVQMRQLINDLLDVSVIESGHFDMKLQPGTIEELVQARIEMFKFSAEKKSIPINLYLGQPITTMFDKGRMAQVVDNLVANAIKFSTSGSPITVRTGHDQDRSWFKVEDHGPGISAEDRTRMFGAFQKLSARPTGQEKSTGLGLSIVKKIVDAHHGEIIVESEVGRGSVFTVTIPSTTGKPNHLKSINTQSISYGC